MADADQHLIRDALRVMITRELRALDREIRAYPDDESVWQEAPGISNSTGTLTLHLAGNLRHFVGAVLGGSGYVRDRASEFSTKGLSREQLSSMLENTIEELERSLEALTDEQISSEYPILLVDRRVRAADFLLHLAVHLGYHLGQIDYHRRLLTASSDPVDALSIRELEAL